MLPPVSSVVVGQYRRPADTREPAGELVIPSMTRTPGAAYVFLLRFPTEESRNRNAVTRRRTAYNWGELYDIFKRKCGKRRHR